MRSLLLTSFFLSTSTLFAVPIPFFSDTTKIQTDSSRHFNIFPHDATRMEHQPGFYAMKVTDKVPFTIYAGMDVFNILQGRAPSLSPWNPASTGFGIRNNGSVIIVDGIAFNSNMAAFYNFNSYEYSQITASGSAAAAFPFGGGSEGGSFFLTSKSGKNLREGELQLNSFTTVNINDQSEFIGGMNGNNRWLFNNTLSYAKDFGPVDTRVSYNFQSNPYSDPGRGQVHNHNIRVNTGVDIVRGLSARLILDAVDMTNIFRYEGSWQPGPGVVTENKSRSTYLQGNVLVKYNFGNGIEIFSRHMLGKLDVDITTPSYITGNDQDKRSHNLIASFSRTVSPVITVGSYAGFTFDKFSDYRTQRSDYLITIREQNFDSWAFIAGANADLKDFLFVDYNFRRDDHSAFRDDTDFYSHSISGTFLWSHAFGLNSPALSLGKLRASFVDGDFGIGNMFPHIPRDETSPTLPVLARDKSLDFGTDLAFFKERFRVSISYFRTVEEGAILVSGMPGGIPPVWTTVETNHYGWEYQLSGKFLGQRDLQLETILSWWAGKNEISQIDGNSGGDDTSPDFPGGPYSTWRSTLLNQLTVKNFFVSALLDFRKNTSLYYRRNGNFVVPVWDTKRMMLVPDFTLGYMPGELKSPLFRRLALTLSVRNLFTIYDSEKELNDQSLVWATQKSISAGVTFTF